MYKIENSVGTLRITIFEGKLLRNTETFGQMDPYIEIMTLGKS